MLTGVSSVLKNDEALVLRVRNFKSPNSFRWVLEDSNGVFLTDHVVELDPRDGEYVGLFDLPGYLRYVSGPDPRNDVVRRRLDEFGRWVGAHVLGDVAKPITAEAPVVVRVVVPHEAETLLAWPLEVTYVGEGLLALQCVSFIFEVDGEGLQRRHAQAPRTQVRILAVFSLPPTSSPLNLRRERQMLRKLVRELRGASGRSVELRVLQYGTTRESMRAALMQGSGWDIIHFSGHGRPGSLVLEHTDGTRDDATAAEIARLLRDSRVRPKLIMLSACLSAAATIDQTLEWLKVEHGAIVAPAGPASADGTAAASVARVLVRELDCAVYAMRYAVEDEFAAMLALRLYQHLLRDDQPLPDAASNALSAIVREDNDTDAQSVAAPALFGRKAASLVLAPPRVRGLDPAPARLAYFPDEPPHFVGRVAAMTDASAALALDGSRSGVLFYGMAGGGKTACAIELAYHLEEAERFRGFVWYSAPRQGDDTALALRDFALALETQLSDVLPALSLVDLVDSVSALEARLPLVIEQLERTAVLIVLDNVESLLTRDDHWRDERWRLVIDALLKPGGLSRVVLTSRVRPANLSPSVARLAINALPLNEAVLLVRELPHLRRLLHGAIPGVSATEGRLLLRRMLKLVQGHPKLLALADGLARDPAQLKAQLDRAEATQDDQQLDAFFEAGETRYDSQSFLDALKQWTKAIVRTFPTSARSFFAFLCALEEPDRTSIVIDFNWSDVWSNLGRSEPPTDASELLKLLADAGLVDRQESQGSTAYKVVLHPAIAEQGRTEMDETLRIVVDSELALFWLTMMESGEKEYGTEPRAAEVIVNAGLAAFPYLSRLGEFGEAANRLQRVIDLDGSPSTLAAALPLLRVAADANVGADREFIFKAIIGRALQRAGRNQEAEAVLRETKAAAAVRGDYKIAIACSGALIDVLRWTGRARDALAVLDDVRGYAKEVQLGPWSQLAYEGWRLQLLQTLGRDREVLEEMESILSRMADLPETPASPDDPIASWNVREGILRTGRYAAIEVCEWQRALELGKMQLDSALRRGDSALQVARDRSIDVIPLVKVGRALEARELLAVCRTIAEDEKDVKFLAAILGEQAVVEKSLGHAAQAVEFTKIALRYNYVIQNPNGVIAAHNNLAVYLELAHADDREILAHAIAGATLASLTGEAVESSIRGFAFNAARLGDATSELLPANFAELCYMLEIDRRDFFGEMVATLLPSDMDPDALLNALRTASLHHLGEDSST